MMKRSIRNSLRWSLVVTLATVLSTGPVAAGWLHRHLHSGSCEPVCASAPPCCEPLPALACWSEPVYSAPIVSCCDPNPCCAGELLEGISTVEQPLQWDGEVLQSSDQVVNGEPVTDAEPANSKTDQDTDQNTDQNTDQDTDQNLDQDTDKSSSDKSSADKAKSTDQTGNPTSKPVPAQTDTGAAGKATDAEKEDADMVAPPAPAVSPAPQPQTLPESDTDDLFNDAAAPGMKLPSDAPPVVPEPVGPPAEQSVDDLFNAADEPLMTEPALDALPSADPIPPAATPAESESIDDLFGAPAQEGTAPAKVPTETPAQTPEAPVESDSVDDLFSVDPAAPLTEPAMPAADAGAKAANDDDLFGDLPGLDAAPAKAPTAPAEDLFGDPATEPKATEPAMPATPGEEGSDDLFSEPPADDKDGALDDLFSQWDGGPEVVENVADLAAAQEPAVASANTLTGLDDTELRTWVDNTGDFRTEGRLVKISDEYVRLLKNNGKTCTVPRSRLSDEDSHYVESIAQRIALFVMTTPNR